MTTSLRVRPLLPLAFLTFVGALDLRARAVRADTDLTGKCDEASLLAAFASATSSSSNVITLQPGCTYTLTAAHDWTYGPSSIKVTANNVVVEGKGATIGGAVNARIFFVDTGASLKLHDVNIVGGIARGGQGGNGGSGSNGNFGCGGGGAAGLGGAIFAIGTVILDQSTISGASAIGGNGGNGGPFGGTYAGGGGFGGGGGLGGNGGDGGAGSAGLEGGSGGGGGLASHGGAGGPAGAGSNGAGGGGGGSISGVAGSPGTTTTGGAGSGGGGAGGNSGAAAVDPGATGGGGGGSGDSLGRRGANGGLGSGGGGGAPGGVGGFGAGGGGYGGGSPGVGGYGGGASCDGTGNFGGGSGGKRSAAYSVGGGGGAGLGGAIFLNGGTLRATNSTLVGNSALGGAAGRVSSTCTTFCPTGGLARGGAIYGLSAAVTLDNVTIAGNTVSSVFGAAGGALFLDGGTYAVTNSILANSIGGDDFNGLTPVAASADHNIVSATLALGISLGSDVKVANPQLGSLTVPTGATGIETPLITSPAIAAANCKLTIDQVGTPRTATDCDIGAVQLPRIAFSLDVTGNGSVDSTPSGITGCRAHCTKSWPLGTTLSLKATPDTSATFKGWSGACTGAGACSFALAASTNAVTATFSGSPDAGDAGTGDASADAASDVSGVTGADASRDGDGDGAPIDLGTPTSESGAPVAGGPVTLCKSNAECTTGHCVDGVCCDTACTETCKSCIVPGLVGTCSLEPLGIDTRSKCGPAGSCLSTCDGHGGCTGAREGAQCAPSVCTGPSEGRGAATCPAEGAPCPLAGTTFDCTPYACLPALGACATVCKSSANCASGSTCGADGRCVVSTGGGAGGCAVGAVRRHNSGAWLLGALLMLRLGRRRRAGKN